MWVITVSKSLEGIQGKFLLRAVSEFFMGAVTEGFFMALLARTQVESVMIFDCQFHG